MRLLRPTGRVADDRRIAMKYLVTGGCGFVGAALCRAVVEATANAEVTVLDNQRRRGAELNRPALEQLGVRVTHGDMRIAGDIDDLGGFDWVIDAAAEPSVLAGTAAGGGTSRRQLVEHNLIGTCNLLESAARWNAGVVILSTSRVYAIRPLVALPLVASATRVGETDIIADAFRPDAEQELPAGVGLRGITEAFSTSGPISLYGATKLASETLATEYCHAVGTPLVVNRCGVMAGAGQFGRADQGIFSWWIHSWAARRQLAYIGFGGRGLQVRDCLHPLDLADLMLKQMVAACGGKPEFVNVSGGEVSATSLSQLSAWCRDRFGPRDVGASPDSRPYDLPWVVLDHSEATRRHGWKPTRKAAAIFTEIAEHAERHPDWLQRCGG
jgi:CDP-paratose 2-epimerase